ncbi:MAG TPA: RNA polymerase sigma factor [Acidobacteriota bacterium]|nr:RNA polymerase sigma factor [Acidobacteriota bacterium]
MSTEAAVDTQALPEKKTAERTEKLLAAAREGDEWAFEELLRLHRSPVYRLALGMLGDPEEASDVCQDVFLRFFRSLRRLRADRGIRAWLRRVTVHRCYDILRARCRTRDFQAEFMPSCMHPEDGFDMRQLTQVIIRALDILSPRERAALILTSHQGYNSIEAGQAMGCRPATVRVLLHKARGKLRKALGLVAGELV